ncbi:fluoride efflux transporter FluC [Aeromicrobium panaciterrae]|uniref:fluoride efflux transporter FluC n=1 Tax=Aeromicrobium panaciterrae TaxID=363861 RepID=UPI0031E16303
MWIALAGGLGAGTRFLVDSWMRPRVSATLPWSTHLINVTGSLLLGLIVGLGAGDTWHSIAGTGFLGGYTTFSTASVETVHLAIDRRYRAAFVNATAMLVVSVAAAAVGYAAGRVIA